MLENVLKYIDLYKQSEISSEKILLTDDQKNILNDQLNLSLDHYTESSIALKEIRKKNVL